MNIANLPAAKYRQSIMLAIPDILSLLSNRDKGVCKAAAHALHNLYQHGKLSTCWSEYH